MTADPTADPATADPAIVDPVTLSHLLDLAAVRGEALPATARRMARFSLFDWLVVARAGSDEPVARIVRDQVVEEGGRAVATVAGAPVRLPARAAALVNGTISHALDYDDTHFAYVGHPSVAILPAALAVGEETGVDAAQVVDAFLLGAEGGCRLGMVLGAGHYNKGFHQTATSGAFGATLAAGRIYGLSRGEMRNALSLVATRAAGLKSQFGTMGKPFNAGAAAANGVEAAALARRGFVSADDGFGGPQGFLETHAPAPSLGAAWTDPPPHTFLFEDVKYKLHACCHGTHAMIESLLKARRSKRFAAADLERIEVRTNPRWLRVCDIKKPRTGLEVKFSYAWLAAMVAADVPTGADEVYTDALAGDPALAGLAGRVAVEAVEGLSDTEAQTVVVLTSGERIETAHDLAERLGHDEVQRGLRRKAEVLLGAEEAQGLWTAVEGLEELSAGDLAALLKGGE